MQRYGIYSNLAEDQEAYQYGQSSGRFNPRFNQMSAYQMSALQTGTSTGMGRGQGGGCQRNKGSMNSDQ
jgi:hypothetical protein